MAQTKNNTKKSGTNTKKSASGSSAKNAKNTSPKKPAAEPETKKSRKASDTAVRDDVPAEESVLQQLTPYLFALAALLLAVCIIAGEGKIGGGIRGLFAGLFSGAAYVLPVMLLVRALTWRRDLRTARLPHGPYVWESCTYCLRCFSIFWAAARMC